MVQFIEVTYGARNKLFIATDKIVSVCSSTTASGSEIMTADGEYYSVKETPEEILEKIEAVQAQAPPVRHIHHHQTVLLSEEHGG